MKRFLLSFVMIFALSLMTNAQVLLQEGFENGVPATWTTIDNDGDCYGWCAMGYDGHSGETCISSASSLSSVGALSPDNWLITPQINLTGNAILKFYLSCQEADFNAEHYAVLISTTGNAISDFTDTLLEETFNAPTAAIRTPTPYVEKAINLSAYTGQQVYIAFRHYHVRNESCLNLDDVRIMIIPTTPTIELAANNHNFDNVVLGTEESWSTTVAGYYLTAGISVSANAPFTLSLDDVNYSSNVTIPAAGGTLYVKYAPTAATTSRDTLILTSAGAPNVTVTVEGTGLDCSNVPLPYACSFADNSVSCWDVVDANNDGYTFLCFRPRAYAVYNHNPNGSADDYLISPAFTFTGGQFASFKYKVASPSYPEIFQILAMGADTIPLTDVMSVNDDQTLFVDLSSLNGSYRIAIHCVSESDGYFLTISDFVVSDFLASVTYYTDGLNYSVVELGHEKVLSCMVTYISLTDSITYSVSAPYSVSTDNINFSSQVVVPQPLTNIENDTIYVKFTPTTDCVYTATLNVSYSSHSDSLALIGRAVDCSEGIAQFPYLYDFNTGFYPPVCWSVNDVANYSAVGEPGDMSLEFSRVDRLVTPEIHSNIPLMLSFDYSSVGGAQAVTSFVVGYSMNTVAEEDFIWYETVVADNTEFETYSNIIPANAKYVAVKVIEINNFLYLGFIRYPNFLYIDNFLLNNNVGVESHEVMLGIYPNPASNIININASENMQKIQVLNMAGQCVYSSQVGGNNTQVNVSNMADGLYFVKVYTDNGNVSTKKIVVRK